MAHQRGMWHMYCFNGLSADQQQRVVEWGNLEFGYVPEGDCMAGAEVEITTMHDRFPGPRFYCRSCAIAFLQATACDCPVGSGEGAWAEMHDPECASVAGVAVYADSEGSPA